MTPRREADCAFCRIAAGESPAAIVAAEERALAFLDARPLFPGHTLVVPQNHTPEFTALSPEDLAAMFDLAQRVARGLEAGLAAEGAFVALNHRISQSVAHVHVHVVPRHKGDGLRGFFWPRGKYETSTQAEEIARKIREAMK